jgi:radical SAM-linked protein
MDILFNKRFSPYYFIKAVSEQLPRGIVLVGVEQVAMQLPSLQSQVRKAEYCVELETGRLAQEVEEELRSFMAKSEFPWQHRRDHDVRHYDIRSLVDRLWLEECTGSQCTVGMCLRADSSATGRAEQVALALGFPNPPRSIHRTKLILAGG